MLRTLLFLPDTPIWRREPDYSYDVGAALYKAYALLALTSDQESLWLDLSQILSKIVPQRMARPQFRNVCFLMGMVYAAQARYEEALAFLEDACDLSVEMEDVPAIADVTFLCGCLARNQLHLSEAAHYFEVALAAFQQLPDSEQRATADKQFDTWIQLTFATYYQAEYEKATHQLEHARRLLAQTSSQSLGKADIEWVEALLSRWRGDWDIGLHQARTTAEVISLHTSSASIVRAKLLVADIALDCVENRSPGTQHHVRAFITEAAPYIHDAMTLARSAHDRAGLGLALLADARLSRLEGKDAPRVATIEAVFDLARQLGDTALLAQAHTALGDEFRDTGQQSAALLCYSATLDALAPSDIPAVGIQAQRQLHRMGVSNSD